MGWLKEELQERGVKAKACYEAIEVSQPTWNKIQLDPTMLSVKQVQRLAYVLKYKPAELLEKILMFDDLKRSGN